MLQFFFGHNHILSIAAVANNIKFNDNYHKFVNLSI